MWWNRFVKRHVTKFTGQNYKFSIALRVANGGHSVLTHISTFLWMIRAYRKSERVRLYHFTCFVKYAIPPAASPSTWQVTCQAYATQLEKEGNYTKAATYLLAIHKVYDAIDLLHRSGHYK